MGDHPSKFKDTIVNKNTVPVNAPRSIEDSIFEAGGNDIKWRVVKLPTYGMVLGFTASVRVNPWMTFNTLSTDRKSKSTHILEKQILKRI